MYRLLTFPCNVGVALTVALLFCLLNFSTFYYPLTIEDIMFISLMIAFYFFLGLFLNRKRPEIILCAGQQYVYKKFLYISILGFAIEFLIYGAPITLSHGRDEFTGIPVLHVVFYSCMLISVLMASLYSTKKAIAVAMISSLVISTLLLSRQMMMISFAILMISIITRYRISRSQWAKLFYCCIAVVILFGVIGNIRQKISGDYYDDYIIIVGGANAAGAAMGSTLYWMWLYIASPLYNLVVNFHSYYQFGEACNTSISYGSCDGSYLTSVVLPVTIAKYAGAKEFLIDLQMAHLNVGTAFSASARLLGLPGVILQIILQVLFYAIGFVITPKSFRSAFCVYFSVLSVYMIFDNLFIKGEFFFVFLLLLCAPMLIRVRGIHASRFRLPVG